MMTEAEAIARQLTTMTGTVISKDDPLVASFVMNHSFMQESHKQQIETLNMLIKSVNQSTQAMTEFTVSNNRAVDKILERLDSSSLVPKVCLVDRVRWGAVYGTLFFSALSFIVLFKQYY
jgi:hypothetical protein